MFLSDPKQQFSLFLINSSEYLMRPIAGNLNLCYIGFLMSLLIGGVTASTWVQKHKEHTGAHEDPVKNVHFVIGNDYALAA